MNPFEEFINAMAQGQMSYRDRLDRMFPEMANQITESAMKMLMTVKNSNLTNGEVTDYVANDPQIVVEAMYGMMNAIEVISGGKIVSRPKGAAPMNVLAAFCTWVWLNPNVTEEFKKSALFQQLIASSRDGFEWDD